MSGCLYIFFVWPFYLMYYMIIAIGYIIYYGIKAIIYIFALICGLISAIIKQTKKNKNYNNYSYTTSSNNKSSKSNMVNSNINRTKKYVIDDAYILVRIEKTVGRKIFDGSSINVEEFGVKDYDCPSTYVDFDIEKYYEVEIYENSSDLAGKLLDAMFNKLKNKMTVEIGKSREDIKYRYYYTDEGVMINNMDKGKILKINSSLRNEYNRINEGVNNRSTLDDNPDDIVNEIGVYNIDIDDFYDVEEYLDDKFLIYEWFYIEQLLTIMAKIDLTPKSKPLVFVKNIEYVDVPTYNNGIINNKNNKNKKSWRDEQFEKEADLWGLSEEDRRIAKQERMSPADYVEADERNDDVLDTDEWK